MSSAEPSSTTPNLGCGIRGALFAVGAFALVLAGLALLGAASVWWTSYVHQSRWPLVQATIRECKLVPRRERNSLMTAQAMECSIAFVDAGGNPVQGGLSARPAYDEHRSASFANPGIDEARAWMAQHPAGSTIAVHYNPQWPPQTEPDQPTDLFYFSSPRLFVQVAEIAGMIGLVLIFAALFVRPRS